MDMYRANIKQDRQCTCNVKMRRVRVAIVAVVKQEDQCV